jgi:HrpA-like RNA helicase
MDPPSPESMQRAMETLLQLEAVDEEFQLTPDGKKLAEFPLEPTLGKLLIAGAELGVATQMASVVAMLNVPPVHMR